MARLVKMTTKAYRKIAKKNPQVRALGQWAGKEWDKRKKAIGQNLAKHTLGAAMGMLL